MIDINRFERNTANRGGGAWLWNNDITNDTLVVRSNRFVANETVESGGGLSIGNNGSRPIVVTNCDFVSNRSQHRGGASIDGNVTVDGCLFTHNTATGSSGAIGISGELTNCVITDNTAGTIAGGISSNGTIRNCLIARNRAESGGGVGTISAHIINCTIVDNIAEKGGGVAYAIDYLADDPIIENTIIAFSGDGGAIYCPPPMIIYPDSDSPDSIYAEPQLICSNLFGNVGGDTLHGVDIGGNISLDPRLWNASRVPGSLMLPS